MRARIEAGRPLTFDDGTAVRSASAVARFGDGWLVAQDDATSAAWLRAESVVPVRVMDAVRGLEVFSEAAGTKHLKPDVEAALALTVAGADAVLLLGSGATPERMRVSLVRLVDGLPHHHAVELAPLYRRVADVLGVAAGELNLEGACRVGDRMRWFHRGVSGGAPPASVDVDLPALVRTVLATPPVDRADPGAVTVGGVLRYDLGEVDGVRLAVTDAVALPDGRVLLAAAAEDTPNTVDDGPVVGAALALVSGGELLARAPLAGDDGTVHKVEGIALCEVAPQGATLLAVVDADDPAVPSAGLRVRVDGLPA